MTLGHRAPCMTAIREQIHGFTRTSFTAITSVCVQWNLLLSSPRPELTQGKNLFAQGRPQVSSHLQIAPSAGSRSLCCSRFCQLQLISARLLAAPLPRTAWKKNQKTKLGKYQSQLQEPKRAAKLFTPAQKVQVLIAYRINNIQNS